MTWDQISLASGCALVVQIPRLVTSFRIRDGGNLFSLVVNETVVRVTFLRFRIRDFNLNLLPQLLLDERISVLSNFRRLGWGLLLGALRSDLGILLLSSGLLPVSLGLSPQNLLVLLNLFPEVTLRSVHRSLQRGSVETLVSSHDTVLDEMVGEGLVESLLLKSELVS